MALQRISGGDSTAEGQASAELGRERTRPRELHRRRRRRRSIAAGQAAFRMRLLLASDWPARHLHKMLARPLTTTAGSRARPWRERAPAEPGQESRVRLCGHCWCCRGPMSEADEWTGALHHSLHYSAGQAWCKWIACITFTPFSLLLALLLLTTAII